MATKEQREGARAVWAAGDFDKVAQRILDVGRDLVERVDIQPGERVLDVACGTGNATIPAAQRGAETTGLDITPELLEDARRNAAEAGVEIEWVEGDAEDLPFEDGSFDVVLSTFGCMFAPDQRTTAREIARVIKPGGRFGLACWRPDGRIGLMFQTIGKYTPPPPEGFQPPPLWGVREHVEGLFADTGVSLDFVDHSAHWHFQSVDEVMDEFPSTFGPIVMLRKALEPAGRWEDFLADLRQMYEDVSYEEDGGIAYDGEYLITLGRRAS
jgi:SAM-dependent methyltransferase